MKKIFKITGVLLGVLAAAVLLLVLVLTLTEYRPDETERLEVAGDADAVLAVGDTVDVLCWNIGFGGLGDNADFFMDGGTMVKPSAKERVMENLAAIGDFLTGEQADLVMLQEVDDKSTHSYYMDERRMLAETFAARGLSYENSLAYNYKTLFVPYPLPPIGREQAGQVTFSAYPVAEALRVSLPCPFSYPVRLANLKRCLLVSRIPLAGSEQEFVVVNLHLEAYDDGEGKLAQTKMLAEFLRDEVDKGNYVIAGGDFNQSLDTVDLSAYPVQGEDLWKPGMIETAAFEGMQCLMDERVPSCRSLDRPYDASDASFQYYVLDGFLLSENLAVERFETVDLGFVNSDHNPVRLQVTLRE